MGEAGVDGDHASGSGEDAGEFAQGQAWKDGDGGAGMGGRDALGALLFLGCSPREQDALAGGSGETRELDPEGFGPMLGGPRRAVQEDDVGGAGVGRPEMAAIDAAMRGGRGNGIPEAVGEKLADAMDGVGSLGDGMAMAVGEGSERFARAGPGESMGGAVRLEREPGAFEEALRVDHGVVAAFGKGASEGGALFADGGLPPVLSPPPEGDGDDTIHGGVPCGEFGDAFFHNPVEPDPGKRGGGVGDGRQGVDDIAEGRRLDDEHLFQRVGSPLEVRRGAESGVWRVKIQGSGGDRSWLMRMLAEWRRVGEKPAPLKTTGTAF